MKIGIIGDGAISRYVQAQAEQHGLSIRALLLKPGPRPPRPADLPSPAIAGDIAGLPDDITLMVDCAGHTALRIHGPALLQAGFDLCTVSLGALADSELHDELLQSARHGNSKLHLVSGAIGALDCLRAGRVGGLHSVTYIGRKPPLSWKDSPAEHKLDLMNPGSEPLVHFEGSAGNAATEYPKNANVAAAVALAGIGFDATQVKLIADPNVTENIHEVEAQGEFGRFSFQINGHSLPDNPRSSALAAMSVISTLEQETQHIVF